MRAKEDFVFFFFRIVDQLQTKTVGNKNRQNKKNKKKLYVNGVVRDRG